MAKAYAPIIMISKNENRVCAFLTISEARGHVNAVPHKLVAGDSWDYFDAKGRPLTPVMTNNKVTDLVTSSSVEQKATIRDRVGKRAAFIQSKLPELTKGSGQPADLSILTLPFGKTPGFEVFVWKLAEVLRHEGSPADPPPGPKDHKGGWWHNVFG